MLGAAASIAFTGMIAFSLGAIIRNGAGAIAASVGLVFVLPIIVQIFTAFVDAAWVYTLAEIIPPNAAARLYDYVVSGQSAMTLPSPDGALVLEPWSALLVLVGWVVVLFGLALALVKRRDV